MRAALPLGPERAAPYVHRRVTVYGAPSSEGHQRVPHAPKRPDGVLSHAGLSPEELQGLPLAMHAQLPGAPRPIGVDIRLFGGSCGLTPRRIASQQRTQVPHSATGGSRKDALWGCHSHGKAHFACGPHQRAHSACGRWLRREAIFAGLCTLLHTHGRSRDRAGATGPTTSKAPWPP